MFTMNVTRFVNSVAGVGACWQRLPEKHKLDFMQIIGIVLSILIFLGVSYIVRLVLTNYTNKAIKRAFAYEIPVPEAINLTDSSI